MLCNGPIRYVAVPMNHVRCSTASYSTVVRDLWQHKQTSSSGCRPRTRWFIAINPWQLYYNYYILLIGLWISINCQFCTCLNWFLIPKCPIVKMSNPSQCMFNPKISNRVLKSMQSKEDKGGPTRTESTAIYIEACEARYSRHYSIMTQTKVVMPPFWKRCTLETWGVSPTPSTEKKASYLVYDFRACVSA